MISHLFVDNQTKNGKSKGLGATSYNPLPHIHSSTTYKYYVEAEVAVVMALYLELGDWILVGINGMV